MKTNTGSYIASLCSNNSNRSTCHDQQVIRNYGSGYTWLIDAENYM